MVGRGRRCGEQEVCGSQGDQSELVIRTRAVGGGGEAWLLQPSGRISGGIFAANAEGTQEGDEEGKDRRRKNSSWLCELRHKGLYRYGLADAVSCRRRSELAATATSKNVCASRNGRRDAGSSSMNWRVVITASPDWTKACRVLPIRQCVCWRAVLTYLFK